MKDETSKKLTEKVESNLLKYCECVEKAMSDFLAGNGIETEALHAMGDCVRVTHHIVKIKGLL